MTEPGGDMGKQLSDRTQEVPRSLHKYCGQCGHSLTEPGPGIWRGVPLEPISGLSPSEYPRRENSLDELWFWWYVYCTNRRCRSYQAFNVGGKLQDEGKLSSDEFEDFVLGQSSSSRQ